MTWYNVKIEKIADLFTLSAEWVTLDEILSSEKFVSLKKVVLHLTLDMGDYFSSYDEKEAIWYTKQLFPTFKRHRTVERHVAMY